MRHKFRAWDKVNKKMYDVTVIDFEAETVQVLHFDDWVGKDPDTAKPVECSFMKKYGKYLRFEDVVLVHSTGLEDKNGVEIYAGDIVRLSYGIPPISDSLVIEYADNETIADISVSGWWMRNIRENGCSSSLCKTYENDLEVIGNKWENPELKEV